MSHTLLLLAACVQLSVQINCRGLAICDVDITTSGSEYPGLIEIDAGTSIRFTNRVTVNMAEHTVTPVKTSNAVNYFGGLSFYATDLGGLYTQTQVICGTTNCMDAFAVKRDPTSPFLTKNWPEADYPYYCQFHGGNEKGIIRVGNGAGKEPPVPPNTDPDTVKKGCCAAPSLCAQSKPAGCKDEWTVQKESGLGYCEPADDNNCLAGGDGLCRWAPASTINCMIQFKKCLDGQCVDIDSSNTPVPISNPCGAPCTNYPAPVCADATRLSFMADATKATCANVAGQFVCQYPKLVLDCTSFGAGTTCQGGKCVQGSTVKYNPPSLSGNNGSPSTTTAGGNNNPFTTPVPGAPTCSAQNCAAPSQCVNNVCQTCTANCASLAGVCPCGVNCQCNSASCAACATTAAAPTTASNQPCSAAAPTGFCSSGQRCGRVGNAYGCELIPPCSQAERERECAVPGQFCQGSNGVYTCGPRSATCSATATQGRCEGFGLQCLQSAAGAYVCATPGQQTATPCSLSNPQGSCATAGYTCNTSALGQVSCGPPPTQPPAPTCQITDAVCKDACKQSTVLKCSCDGVQCDTLDSPGGGAASPLALASTLPLIVAALVMA